MEYCRLPLTLLLLVALPSFADVTPQAREEIAHLKKQIIESSCVFTRNDVNYKGSKAVTHIIRKEEYYQEQIVTAEDFIRLAATKSEMSGKPYTVSCTEGVVENLGDWFHRELAAYRAQKTVEEPALPSPPSVDEN